MQGSTVALISTMCTFSSAICMAIGWWFIKRKDIRKHQFFMIAAVVLAALFFILYISRTIFIGNTDFGGPDYLRPYYYSFLGFHILLTITSPVLGIMTLYLARNENFVKHKRIGRITARIWFITAATGLLVYLILFSVFPEGETVNKFKEYFGSTAGYPKGIAACKVLIPYKPVD